MSSLSSVLSLNRLKNKKFSEGEEVSVAGRLKEYSKDSLVLQGQEEEKRFLLNPDSFFENQDEKIPINKWSQYLKPHQCVLLQLKVTQGVQTILSVRLLTDSAKKPLSYNFHYARLWHAFLRAVEDFFIKEGCCPVPTPALVPCPGTESHLRFFSTQKRQGSVKETLWLASSPEIHLKKLLCRNGTDIFEIHKCFRNEEQGFVNWNEFHMLEWYRAYADSSVLMTDLRHLISYLKEKQFISYELKEWNQVSVQSLFKQYCDFNLTPSSNAQDLIPVLEKKNIPYSKTFSFEDLFHLIFLNIIEPQLNPSVPTIVYHYPPSLRAYSRLTAEGWADRFEFYWQKLELANAFNEITDVQEQKDIFEKDIKSHKEKNLKLDLHFLNEMEAGFPPTSGIALGLERLFMACQKLDHFPLFI